MSDDFDAIIIGAGMSGMYQLLRLRQLGMRVRVFETGTGVGGTWYWNRYPGARFDSESYSYGFSFSPELLQEWSWSEHFAPQPETLRYLNHVADRFDLRRDIQFNSRVASAVYREATRDWVVTLADGSSHTARFLITAVGPLSAPTLPRIEGRDSFEGQSFHTYHWPHEPVDFAGKRVAVIGTGATGVQTIQEVSKTAATLTVFQRTPNWCAPLHNRPITEEEQARIKASYDEIFRRCDETFSCFLHTTDPRGTFEVSADEREAFLEKLYSEPGFGIWVGLFRDMLTDPAANAIVSDFIARKIRGRVKNQAVAEKLIPKNHGFGTRRVPLETRYYEVYNQPNVTLVDIKETPIERITPTGIRTSNADYAFDIIVFATGFDAMTGPLLRMDITGRDGVTLQDAWREGPKTYLGLQVSGFPNLFTVTGPGSPSVLTNMPVCIEQHVEWITDCIAHLRANGIPCIEPTPEAMEGWVAQVNDAANATLLPQAGHSWYLGANVPGKPRVFMPYAGGMARYRAICADVAARGYDGFALGAPAHEALETIDE